jgi:hypothetical protein
MNAGAMDKSVPIRNIPSTVISGVLLPAPGKNVVPTAAVALVAIVETMKPVTAPSVSQMVPAVEPAPAPIARVKAAVAPAGVIPLVCKTPIVVPMPALCAGIAEGLVPPVVLERIVAMTDVAAPVETAHPGTNANSVPVSQQKQETIRASINVAGLLPTEFAIATTRAFQKEIAAQMPVLCADIATDAPRVAVARVVAMMVVAAPVETAQEVFPAKEGNV